MKIGVLHRALLPLAVVLFLAGCGGKEQYYRLSESGPAATRTGGIAVAVGPLQLPTYVDRAELVFQSGPNRFEIPAKVRWAGALQDNFGQVLATDIGRHLNSGNVVANPAPGDARFRYRVEITVRQFHAISGQDAILDVGWRIEDAATREVRHSGDASFHARIEGDGYAAVVAAESDLVEQLAAAISRSL